MDNFQKDFIRIIQSAFTKTQYVPSPDFDWDKATEVARKHNVVAIFYYGAVNCGISSECVQMQELFTWTCRSLAVSHRQIYEIEKIIDMFECEGIEYMPLKGAVLKKVYPRPEMRTMGDADILIKLDQYDKIKAIMRRLGFVFQYESDHELVWKKPTLFLELHKSIMTTYNRDFYSYFGSGWKVANRAPGTNGYEMSPEDFYIYLFVHFTKHYRISGIGIKHLLDLWVYAEANSGLNREYIQSELTKMHLNEFYKNMMDTIDAWFYSGQESDIVNVITNVLFNSGQYGSADMAIVNRAIRDNKGSAWRKKLTIIIRSMFLPYHEMKERYSVLERISIMLPVMWVVRWIDVLFFRQNVLKQFVASLKLINSRNLDEHTKVLHFVGLDFNHDESGGVGGQI